MRALTLPLNSHNMRSHMYGQFGQYHGEMGVPNQWTIVGGVPMYGQFGGVDIVGQRGQHGPAPVVRHDYGMANAQAAAGAIVQQLQAQNHLLQRQLAAVQSATEPGRRVRVIDQVPGEIRDQPIGWEFANLPANTETAVTTHPQQAFRLERIVSVSDTAGQLALRD